MNSDPVTVGNFANGSDLVLWSPDLATALTRRHSRFWSHGAVAWSGTLFILIGLWPLVVPSRLSFTVGIPAMLLGLTIAAIRCLWLGDYVAEHLAARRRGEFSYHNKDFRDFPRTARETVDAILRAVRALHTNPAASWLSPQDLHDVHLTAWEALYALDRTRPLREVLADSGPCAAARDDVRIATDELRVVEQAAADVARWLNDAVALTDAWAAKLHLQTFYRQFSPQPSAALRPMLSRAESATMSIFASVTAARDVTNAGPFAWETVCFPNDPRLANGIDYA